MNNILLETDSPYLSPFRGKKNESANIKYICDYIAQITGKTSENIEKITTSNAYVFFDFNRKI